MIDNRFLSVSKNPMAKTLAQTAAITSINIAKCSSLGAVDYITKPFEQEEIKEVMVGSLILQTIVK
ncbi:MAG: hypothetical protein KME50_22235 [Nostoc desertorum CM1-VF14]|jgi:CheY-like chemotaxis protein|nr:hypothetical protein [Nostoc desertorum CM1-VF14]